MKIAGFYNELLEIIQFVSKDKRLLDEFLKDILTPQELEEIPKRWQIIKELSQGTPQREIADKLGVAIATITRGSKELKDPKGGFHKVLNKL